MAERTHTFASFSDGAITVSYVYDDTATRNPLRVVAVNDHPTLTLHAGVGRIGTGWGREFTWGPDTGTSIVEVPFGQRARFDIEPDTSGLPGAYDTLSGVRAWAYVSEDG